MKAESTMEVIRAQGRENRELFNRYRISVWDGEKFWK
jgi:hypothetical protein